MGIVQEFKEFINRGNVVDLAVGVVIGGAFGKIVSSLVADVITPLMGVVIGGVNFTSLKIHLGGKPDAPVNLNYGNFLQSIVDFLIIAFAIFLFVKAVNAMKREKEASAPPPEPPKQEVLLAEIRDLLKGKNL
jgi:large conductance mechanosensitive channel